MRAASPARASAPARPLRAPTHRPPTGRRSWRPSRGVRAASRPWRVGALGADGADDAGARFAAAAADPAPPFVTPEHARRGEVIREWISDAYEVVDYERALRDADALAAEAALQLGDDARLGTESDELTYGEFDVGFFLALLDSLEPELAALEYGDVDGGAVVAGSFVDIGSGRGQIPLVASHARSWQRCVGLELVPVLHAVAEQVALSLPNDELLTPERIRCLPSAMRPSPCSFVRGDMYDEGDLAAALEGATLVFLFSTKFSSKRVFEAGGGGGGAGSAAGQPPGRGGGDAAAAARSSSASGDWEVKPGTLVVSSHVRPHLRVGAFVITVNATMREADGYELVHTRAGPDAERAGGSVAYVYRVVPVVCEANKNKKKKKIVS